MSPRARSLLVVVLAFPLLLPACGSDGGSAGTDLTVPVTATTASVTAATVPVTARTTAPTVPVVTAPAVSTTTTSVGPVSAPSADSGQPATTPADAGRPAVGTIDPAIVLAGDGLGVAAIGDPAAGALAALTAVLGQPVAIESAVGDRMALPRDFVTGTGSVMTTYRWSPPELRVVMTDALRPGDGVEPAQVGELRFAWWEYDGDPTGTRQFATREGITVGSSKADLDAAHSPSYPGEDCDQQPAPELFEFGPGGGDTSPGIAGRLDDSESWVMSLRSAVSYCS